MRSILLTTWLAFVGPALSAEREIKVEVAESGSPAVDALVLGLVSKRPAPLPAGGKFPISFHGGGLLNSGRYSTDEVEAAVRKLEAIPPKEYAHLVEHLDDDRYSYSVIGPHGSPTNSGWMNRTVGDVIYDILIHGMTWAGGYKMREVPSGKDVMPPYFGEYIEAQGGMEKWAESVAALTRGEIDRRFLDWCIQEEEKAGFKDAEQRAWVLGRYEEKKRELEKAKGAEGGKAGE